MTKKDKKKVEKNKQLELGLASPIQNLFLGIKSRIVARLRFFESNQFINDPLVWFFTMFMGIGALYQLLIIVNSINAIPELIPLFKSTTTPEFILVNKLYLFTIPIISLIIFTITFRNSKKIYYKNDNLSKFTLFISFLSVLIISFHLISILAPYV